MELTLKHELGKTYWFIDTYHPATKKQCEYCEGTGKVYTASGVPKECVCCSNGEISVRGNMEWRVTDNTHKLSGISMHSPDGPITYHFENEGTGSKRNIQDCTTTSGDYFLIDGIFPTIGAAIAECKRRNQEL